MTHIKSAIGAIVLALGMLVCMSVSAPEAKAQADPWGMMPFYGPATYVTRYWGATTGGNFVYVGSTTLETYSWLPGISIITIQTSMAGAAVWVAGDVAGGATFQPAVAGTCSDGMRFVPCYEQN